MSGQWLTDPTGRHQERYQEGTDWTARVRDRGVENEDPIGLAMLSPTATEGPSFGRIEPSPATAPSDYDPATGPWSPAPIGVTDPTLVAAIPVLPEAPSIAPGEAPKPASSRRRLIIGVGVAAAVLLVAGAITAVAMSGPDEAAKKPIGPKPVAPAVPLRAGETAMTESLSYFDTATTLAAVDAAGVKALTGIATIDRQRDDVSRIKSPAAKDATQKALTHEREILVALGGLKGYTGENIQRWILLSAAADNGAGALQLQLDRLSELHAYTPKAQLVDEVAATRSTIDGNLRAIDTKLTAWKTETARVQAAKTAELTALDSYASGVRAQAARYSSLRKSMQDFVDRVDTSVVTFDEAYSTLADASSQRSDVRANLAAINPPAAAAAAHNGLLSVLDTAVSAVSDATDGIRQYQSSAYYDSSYYCDSYYCDPSYRVYYKDTPGWQTFVSKSDSITASYDGALRAWESAVAGERARINAIALPPKPSV